MTHTDMTYYLQRKHSGYWGNSPVWWAKGGKGYTAYIQNAEKFTSEKAHKFITEDSGKWAIYPCEQIERRLHAVFDMQDFQRLEEDLPESGNPWGENHHYIDFEAIQ